MAARRPGSRQLAARSPGRRRLAERKPGHRRLAARRPVGPLRGPGPAKARSADWVEPAEQKPRSGAGRVVGLALSFCYVAVLLPSPAEGRGQPSPFSEAKHPLPTPWLRPEGRGASSRRASRSGRADRGRGLRGYFGSFSAPSLWFPAEFPCASLTPLVTPDTTFRALTLRQAGPLRISLPDFSGQQCGNH